MSSTSGSAQPSRTPTQQTLNSLRNVSKGSVLTIPLVQSLQLSATDAATTQLKLPLQSFETRPYNNGDEQSKVQSSLHAFNFHNTIPLPKPPASSSVEVIQSVSSATSSLPSIVPLNAINLSVIKVPIIDFDTSSKSCYDNSVTAVAKNDSLCGAFNDRLFSSNHFSTSNSESNITISNAASNLVTVSAHHFENTKLNANPDVFATVSNKSNISVLASVPLVPRGANTTTNPRRYRAIRPLIRPSCEETKNILSVNTKWEEHQIHNLSHIELCSPSQSSPMSRSDTSTSDFGRDDSVSDVNPFISVVRHLIDSVDSHVESAVITVDETGISDDSVRNCSDQFQFNNDNNIRDFVIENSIASFQTGGVGNGDFSEDTQFTEHFTRSLGSTCINKSNGTGLCSESYSLGTVSQISYETAKCSYNAVPTYPNFLCVICGKSEVLTQQKCLHNASVGQDPVLVVTILMKLLNTTSTKLFEKGEKICLHCMNTLHEIEILKGRVQMKESVVRELYATTSSWINKFDEDESCDWEFPTSDLSETQLPSELDQGNTTFSSHNSSHPLKESILRENFRFDSSSNGQSVPSRRRKQFRCLKCHTSFFNTDDRKVHMRRCRGGKVKPLESRGPPAQIAMPKQTTSLSANLKKPTGMNRKNHSHNSYSCGECSKTFPSRISLANHASSHQTSYDCHVCFRYLTTKARLEAHLFKFHGIGEGKVKSIQCNLCDKAFQTKAGLCYHKNVAHQVGTKYLCEHCQKVYYYHVPYRSHMLFAHGKKKIVCETCGAMFFTVSKLNTHINAVHRNAETWQCLKCDVKFTTSTAFRQHNLVKHFNTKHACDYCPAQFRKVSSLHSHLKEHSIYLCKACQLTFVDEYLYNLHMLEIHNRPILKHVKRRSYTLKKNRVKPETSSVTLRKIAKTDTVDVSNQLHQINLNDILLSNSFSNSSNLQVLTNISLGESSGKIRTFNLVNSDTGLEMPSNSNTLPLTDDVSFINVEILNNIEISDNTAELNAGSRLDNHQNFDTESLSDMANLETNLSSNLTHSVTPFGADSEVINATSTGVIQLVKQHTVGAVSASEPGLHASAGPLNHSALQAGIHRLEATVNDLSPPAVDIEQPDDITAPVGDIEPSVHQLSHSDKAVDPANIWMKESAWALLKSGSNNDENLRHLQNLPSSGIEDLDIGVIGGDIVDASVINDTDTIAIDLDLHVPNTDATDPRLDNIDVDITG